jgi:hypothetical protein
MRSFIGGSGTNTTSAVVTYLAANRALRCADLLQLQTAIQGQPWSQNVLLTSFDRPLTWSQVGTFVPGRFTRGEVDSQIGLDTVSMDLEWCLRDSDVFFNAPGGVVITQLQAFERGLWDNGLVNVYRTVMPTLGDANTYGAMQLFGGRIGEVSELSRTGVKLKVNSLLELLDLNVPTNLIEATNVQCQYGIGQPPAGLSAVPVFSVVAGAPAGILWGSCVSPNSGQLFGADTFDFGYIQFVSGSSLGQIFRSVWFSEPQSVSGGSYNAFYLYDQLPWRPAVGEQFMAYVPYARATEGLVTESDRIPSSSPYTVAVVRAGQWVSDAGVSGISGTYSATNGVYTFTSTDAGKTVTISYNVATAGTYQGFPYVPVPETAT